jgi:hypothetical protein
MATPTTAITKLIDTKNMALRPLPETADAQAISFIEPTPPASGVDDVDCFPSVISESAEMDFDFKQIERKFRILGVRDGGIVGDIQVGETFGPCTVVHNIGRGAPRPAPRLNLQPVVAAATATVIDRNYLQAVTAINTMFLNEKEAKMTTAHVSWIRQLANGYGDPTRLLFRFAQMFAYYLVLEKGDEQSRPLFPTPAPTFINSVAQVSTVLHNACRGEQYLSVHLNNYVTDHAMVLSVLRTAAVGTPFPDPKHVTVPTVLLANLQLPPIQVVYTGDESCNVNNPNITAADIWEVMYTYASQIGVKAVLDEMVSLVFTLMYSPVKDRDPVFRCPIISYALPSLQLSYYGLFPIAVAADSIIGPDVPDLIALHDLTSRMVLRSQLLSVAYREVLWELGLGAKQRSTAHLRRSMLWRRNILTRGTRPCAPIWGIMLEFLNKNGLRVTCSETMLSCVPHSSTIPLFTLAEAMESCSCWTDVFDVIPTVPAAALDAFCHPKKSTKLLQPGVRYKVENISADSLPSVWDALTKVGATFEQLIKKKGDLNWRVCQADVIAGKYGLVADRPIPKNTVDHDLSIVVTARVPDSHAALRLHVEDEAAKRTQWFIDCGVERLGTYDFDTSGGESMPMYGSVYGDKNDDQDLGPPDHGAPPPESRDSAVPDLIPPEIANTAAAVMGLMDVVVTKEAEEKHNADAIARMQLEKDAKPAWVEQKITTADQIRLDTVRLYCAPGLCLDVASAYEQLLRAPSDAPAREIRRHMDPIAGPTARALENISIVEAVRAAPRNRRAGTLANLSIMCARLAENVTDQLAIAALSRTAERANSASTALKVCSALTTSELADDDQVWAPEVGDWLGYMGESAILAGIPLSQYTAPKAVGVDTVSVPLDEIVQREGDGWRRNRKQDGVEVGKVLMYKPKTPTYANVNLEAATNLIMMRSEAFNAEVDALIAKLDQRVGSASVPVVDSASADDGQQTEQADQPIGSASGAAMARESIGSVKLAKEVELPAGDYLKERDRGQKTRAAIRESKEAAVAREECVKMADHWRTKGRDYNDPWRKEYCHSKALALEVAVSEGVTAAEFNDAMMASVGQPQAFFRLATAPLPPTSPSPTASVVDTTRSVEDVDQEEDPDALGPPPVVSTSSPPGSMVDPDQLETLEMT